MTRTVLISLLILSSSYSFASGTYRSSSRAPRVRQVPPRPPIFQQQPKSSTTQSPRFTGPTELRNVTLLDKMNKLRRSLKVSVHNSHIKGKYFSVKGSYTQPSQFQEFLNRMRESIIDKRTLTITKKKNSFAGRKSYDFVIKGQNLWN